MSATLARLVTFASRPANQSCWPICLSAETPALQIAYMQLHNDQGSIDIDIGLSNGANDSFPTSGCRSEVHKQHLVFGVMNHLDSWVRRRAVSTLVSWHSNTEY